MCLANMLLWHCITQKGEVTKVTSAAVKIVNAKSVQNEYIYMYSKLKFPHF